MIRNGKPPIKAVNIGPPIIPENPATKQYVDESVPTPPTIQRHVDVNCVSQGYIPTGVNTKFYFNPLGGIISKDLGNEIPLCPVLAPCKFVEIRAILYSVSSNPIILKMRYNKNDVFSSYQDLYVNVGSRQSNIETPPPELELNFGDRVYATVDISGALAANFLTITMRMRHPIIDVQIDNPLDTALLQKHTAKQEISGQMVHKKTFSQRILAIFR